MAAAVTELQSHYQGLQPPEGTDFVAVITDGSSHDKDEGKHTLGPRSTGTTAAELDTEVFLPSLKKAPGESAAGFVKRVLTEGHTVPDAFLSVAAAQIGQIMLTTPNSLYKTGVAVGLGWSVFTAVVSLYTMFLLSALYLQRKKAMIKQGVWFDASGRRKVITQYHEVIGFFLGPRMQVFAQVLIALGLIGTSVAQIIACAGDMYYIDKSKDKRTWELIWGGVLMVFAFVPTFRHFRVLNIIALIGTTYTAILVFVLACQNGFSSNVHLAPRTAIDFFTGGAVLLNAMGAHSVALEMMDAMQRSSHYLPAYFGGWTWTALLVLPHSVAVNYAFPQLIGKNDNVYGVLPVSAALKVSVWLMVIHQLVAFALYCTPLLYMWEKLVGTHTKAWYIRLPSRLPVALLMYFLGVAFPFYGSINSLMGAISAPTTAFMLPAITYNLVYRSQAARDAAVLPPPKALQVRQWRLLFGVNWCIAALFGSFGITAIVFSIIKIVDNSYTFGVFASCYQCSAAAGAHAAG